jgi:hypothetical protein
MISGGYFPLPWSLISNKDHSKPIGELFREEQFFSKASDLLYNAIFASNPIDQLYWVHISLMTIHKGALANRTGDRRPELQDVNQLLCFDDLFSLFLGTLLASEMPDVFWVSWLIGEYAPKSSLSPSFEYAEANIEALVLHIQQVDVDSLEEKSVLGEGLESSGSGDNHVVVATNEVGKSFGKACVRSLEDDPDTTDDSKGSSDLSSSALSDSSNGDSDTDGIVSDDSD